MRAGEVSMTFQCEKGLAKGGMWSSFRDISGASMWKMTGGAKAEPGESTEAVIPVPENGGLGQGSDHAMRKIYGKHN